MWLFWAVAALVLFFVFVIGLYVAAIYVFVLGVATLVKVVLWAVRVGREGRVKR